MVYASGTIWNLDRNYKMYPVFEWSSGSHSNNRLRWTIWMLSTIHTMPGYNNLNNHNIHNIFINYNNRSKHDIFDTA